jgi:hypothetical protein
MTSRRSLPICANSIVRVIGQSSDLAPKRPKSDVSATPNQSLEQTAAATVSPK